MVMWLDKGMIRKRGLRNINKAYVLVVTLAFLTGISFMISYLNIRIRSERWWFRSLILRGEVESLFPKAMEAMATLAWLYQNRYGELPRHLHFWVVAGKTLRNFEVWVNFSLEREKLNLNRASREDLLEFFRKLGFKENRAVIMTDSLLDWRDSDDNPRFEGAEKDFYLHEYGDTCQMPPNRPLKDLREIPYIRGFDPYIFWVDPALIDRVTLYATSSSEGTVSRETFTLEEGGVYRMEVKVRREGKKYKGIFIFKIQNGKVQKLFSVVI